MRNVTRTGVTELGGKATSFGSEVCACWSRSPPQSGHGLVVSTSYQKMGETCPGLSTDLTKRLPFLAPLFYRPPLRLLPPRVLAFWFCKVFKNWSERVWAGQRQWREERVNAEAGREVVVPDHFSGLVLKR